ncbi:L-seryl-tRNA(Sec) selenium transferase [Soehngenia longivitae]|uniref:L-seryl-tRNA(Sec) selenium transferase n=2 Tax=Soehngenia longivitae TaxID=2562294 RepID=A0A4Z0D5P7_9FIRM|nr:L-seryl-tRNA(Sec) selenium transferase [Soehngenia longivitae]
MIPKVDEILADDRILDILKTSPRKIVIEAINEEIDKIRSLIQENEDENRIITELNELILNIINNCIAKNKFSLRRVVNATGVIIHTNLGRSLLNPDIIDNIMQISTNYSNLEFDIEKGKRGSRYSHLEKIISQITGGEAALVVNNNAAAVLLVLSTVAKDKNVIVSRGELIEIGGSFRIPEVMEQSGAILKEVGTTNKTHFEDYLNAIDDETSCIMKVHTSNYKILGFTSDVPVSELKKLKSDKILLIEDLGSGVLIDLSKYGISYEPTVSDSIKNGADIVTFSGDKLLGGPQAGIIVGKKELIDKMKKNPLTRALRVDKFTISALEATFRYYLDEATALSNVPTLSMIVKSIDDIEKQVLRVIDILKPKINSEEIIFDIVDDFSEVGGGSLPLEKINTKCLAIELLRGNIVDFERNLRNYEIPVISRIFKDRVLFDFRTIREDEEEIVIEAILNACKYI